MRLTAIVVWLSITVAAYADVLPDLKPAPDNPPEDCSHVNQPCCPGFDDVNQKCLLYTYSAASAICLPDPSGSDGGTICVECGGPRRRCCPGTEVGSSKNCANRAGDGVCMAADSEDGVNMCVECGALDQPCCGPEANYQDDPDYTGCPGPLRGPSPPLVCESGTCVAKAGPRSKLYEQCGGQNFDGPDTKRACVAGAKCEFQNQWYSQCVPDPNAPLDGQPLWSQCGGKEYTGETKCAFGYPCNQINEWYSQCQPQ